MRPVSLTLSAFGSYDKQETVDFSALSERGIFLICGPTGGGKTTLLDAMSMALYGKATGSLRNRQSRIFRCRSSERSNDTLVDFVFALGEQKYRFLRRWRVGKTAGEDALKDAENACYIADENGEWQLIASGAARSIEAEAERILGLSHDQFVKVICLPQGEFRELLTTDSTRRTEIFEKLFGTDRWKLIAAAASRQTLDVQEQLRQTKERIAGLLTGAELESAQMLRMNAEQTAAALEEMRRQLAEASSRYEIADINLTSALEIDSRFKQLDLAAAQLEQLDLKAGEMAEIERQLSRDATLTELLTKYSLLDEAKAQEAKAVTALAQCLDRKQQSEAILGDATLRHDNIGSLREQVDRLKSELTLLRSFKSKTDELSSIQAEITSGEDAVRLLEEQISTVSADINTHQTRIDNGRALIAECDTVLAQSGEAARQHNEAASQLERICELEKLAAQTGEAKRALDEAQKSYAAAEQLCSDKKHVLAALEQLVSADAAYSLSHALEDGKPCPVCGSTEHPSPAPAPSDAPDKRVIETQRAELESAQTELEKAAAALSGNTAAFSLKAEQLEQKRSENSADISREQAEIILNEATARLERINKYAEQKPKYISLLEKLVTEQDAFRERSKQLSGELMTCSAGVSAARARLSALTDELREQGVSIDGIADAIEQRESRCRAAETEIQASQEAYEQAGVENAAANAALDAARQTLDAARERLALLSEDYASDCAVRSVSVDDCIPDMLLEPEQAAELRRMLSDYVASVDSAQQTRSRLEKELSGRSRPQTAELRAIRDALSEKKVELSAECGKAEQRAATLSAAAAELDKTEREQERLTDKYTALKRVSSWLSGANEKKTPIDQFVAGLLLDEIITAANGYWDRLSRGQYALRRREDAVGRQRYQGVDFEVIDAHIGQTREIYTLSGGELFLASLSLAFGLSDVVQSFSGSMRLDSIFIDEGFGSLDHESLELAMRAIGEIREGRLVGIISHVEELETRVGSRIEITKDEAGSHAKIII